MRFTINKRLAALVLATTVVASQLPTVAFATGNTNGYATQQEEANKIYTNSFENESDKPNEAYYGPWKPADRESIETSVEDGMLKFQSKFDGTSDWDNNKHEITFYHYNEVEMNDGAIVSFDLLVPTEKVEFGGEIKFKAVIKQGSGWDYTGGTDGSIDASKFVDMGNGYSKVTVQSKISDSVNLVQAVVLEFSAYECTFEDFLYIDNINVEKVVVDKPIVDKEFYENSFEEDKNLPNEAFHGPYATRTPIETSIENEMLKFKSQFDGTADWDSNKHELTFYTHKEDAMTKGATVKFDIIVPTDKVGFSGEMKFKAVLKQGDGWDYTGGTFGAVDSSEFEDLGNGYSKVTVESKITDSVTDLKAIVIELSAYECTYTDYLYIDNLKVSERVEEDVEIAPVEAVKWDFANGIDGWTNGGSYAYTPKDYVLEHEKTIGDGSMKLTLDFTNDSTNTWSEVKINSEFEEININGYNLLSFDFIYDSSIMTKGSFKTKVWAKDVDGNEGVINKDVEIKFNETEDLGNGLTKVRATVPFSLVDANIEGFTFSIIGNETNYKGDIYIDNIELGQAEVRNIYVDITEEVKDQGSVDVSELELTSDAIKFVDNNITSEAASLYSYLMGIGKSDKVIYGHQNDTHKFIGKVNKISDSKDITGSISGMIGIDTLSFTGDEGESVDYAAEVSISAAAEGGVITLSSHMPNFDVVAKKGLDENGNYDYSGYSCPDTSGNIVQRIMPGGDLNAAFTGYLDLIADYGLQLQEAGVPVLFRPFHENNGSWFWWGKAFCDEEGYKNLYRYTVEYLRDYKGVNNFIYVYSPNGPFNDEEDYLQRYPGDDFIDVIAFDMYHDDPLEDDNWMSSFEKTINLVQGIADSRGKLSIVAETGLRAQYSVNSEEYYAGLAPEGNKRKEWFNEVLEVVSKSNMASFMVWANFSEPSNFSTPFKATETTGHEMINEFIDFYNDGKSIFASEIVDVDTIEVNVDETEKSYGYFLAPVAGSRILESTDLLASVKAEGKVQFKLNDSEGNAIVTLEGTEKEEGLYSASITESDLAKMGETVGSIDLVANGKVLNSIKIFFNIEEQEKAVSLVDDFESYMGENDLLLVDWATNSGPGCNLKPQLTTAEGTFNGGKYGLAFNYTISNKEVGEGWAGMTIAKEADWSEYDALQLWIKPDGNAQKLVIQITSDGEDFEVFLNEFAGTTEAQLVTLPFDEFVGKKNGTFDPTKISSIGLWCNTVGSEKYELTSTMYFDDINAVNTSDLDEGEDGNEGGNTGGNEGGDGSVDVKPETKPEENGGGATVKPDTDSDKKDELPKTGGVNSLALLTAAIGAMGIGGALTRKKKYKK